MLPSLKGYYINLEDRKDRLDAFQQEQQANPWLSQIRRFEAIREEDNGHLGCAKSHVRVLEMLLDEEHPDDQLLGVFEDDLQIINNQTASEFFQAIARLPEGWEVLVVTPMWPVMEIGTPPHYTKEGFVRVVEAQTTTGYILRKATIPILLGCFRNSVKRLQEGEKCETSSIDQNWKLCQRRMKFLAYQRSFATQRAGYSTICGKEVDYTINECPIRTQPPRGYYINLPHRTDRMKEFESLRKDPSSLGLFDRVTRLEAVVGRKQFPQLDPANAGALGCTLSHIRALESLYKTSTNHTEVVGVFEDDFVFAKPDGTQKLIALLPVLLVASNWFLFHLTPSTAVQLSLPAEVSMLPDFEAIDVVRVANAFTTSGYFVRVQNIPHLLQLFRLSANALAKGASRRRAALDTVWIPWQRKVNFLAFKETFGVQRPGHSDIENRRLNYAPLFQKRPTTAVAHPT